MYVPYYDKMISVVPFGRSRPSIPEYPEIAHYVKAVNDITKSPMEALDIAATKSAFAFGILG